MLISVVEVCVEGQWTKSVNPSLICCWLREMRIYCFAEKCFLHLLGLDLSSFHQLSWVLLGTRGGACIPGAQFSMTIWSVVGGNLWINLVWGCTQDMILLLFCDLDHHSIQPFVFNAGNISHKLVWFIINCATIYFVILICRYVFSLPEALNYLHKMNRFICCWSNMSLFTFLLFSFDYFILF